MADADGQPLPTLAPMLEKVTPAVVNIATRGTVTVRQSPLLRDPFFRRFCDVPRQPRQRQTQSLGSGVVVDAREGYILTNHHVVDNADEIEVTLKDGRVLAAELVGNDDTTVLRVLKESAREGGPGTLAERMQARMERLHRQNPGGL